MSLSGSFFRPELPLKAQCFLLPRLSRIQLLLMSFQLINLLHILVLFSCYHSGFQVEIALGFIVWGILIGGGA